MNYVIILAGGVGSRFWPLSRQTEPKQFLPISSKRPLLADALQRLGSVVDKSRIYIATSRRHAALVKHCTKPFGLSPSNFLFEPSVKNTLAPIAVLSEKISRQDPHAVIAVLPCDHFVKNVSMFRATLKRGFSLARAGGIVTFGFPPVRPETGYGYIKARGSARAGAFSVERFVEKPSRETAQKFMKDKRYFWNAGVFIFSAVFMNAQVKRFVPAAGALVRRMVDTGTLLPYWQKLSSISVDYAVMEKTSGIAVMPARYGWLDVGSWQAVYDVMPKDKSGNILRGPCINVDSSDSLVWSGGRLIAAVGVRDLIIVDTPDALLVCARGRDQDVKKVVEQLRNKDQKRYI